MRPTLLVPGATQSGGHGRASGRPRPRHTRRRRRSRGLTPYLVAAFQTLPVSSAVAAPFLILVFPSAILGKNPYMGFLIAMFALGVLPPLIVELLNSAMRAALRLPSRAARIASSLKVAKEGSWLPAYRIGVGLIFMGGAANILRARAGVGTIESQVGLTSAGGGGFPLVLALVVSYDLLGTFIVTWCFAVRAVGRAGWLTPVACAVAMKVIYVTLTGITAPLFDFLIGTFIAGFFLGIVRVRWLALGALAVAVVWPPFYQLRNEIRLERGVQVSETVSATDRFALDRLVASGHGLGTGQDVGQLSPLEVFRYGLIPRVLDPSRPSLDTGSVINERLLNGSPDSSATFLQVATPYVLYGAVATVLIMGITATLVALIMDVGRWLSPYAYIVVLIVLTSALSWTGSYPDSFAAALQQIVAALPIFALLAIGRRRRH